MDIVKNMFQYAATPQSRYLKGRAVSGGHAVGPSGLMALRKQITSYLDQMAKNGGVVFQPFTEDGERTALLLIYAFGPAVQDIHYSQFLGEPYLATPPEEASIWIIHHAPRFPDFQLAVEQWLKPGRVVLATGLFDEWQQRESKVPFLDLRPIEIEPGQSNQDEVQSADKIGLLQRLVHITNLFDAWGIPLPVDYLERVGGEDPDDFTAEVGSACEKGILFWVEREKPPALLISTAGESLARKYLLNNLPKLQDYFEILGQADPEDREDRYTVLKLFQSWLSDPRLRHRLSPGEFGLPSLRREVRRRIDSLGKIFSTAPPQESLLWGLCLSDLGLLQEADLALNRALKRTPKNIFLAASRATNLARWAQVEPGKLTEANRAFDSARRLAPKNPFIPQARGVMAARLGDRNSAHRDLNRALELAPKNVVILVAMADLALDKGDFEEVGKILEKARELDSQNVYVRHMDGRLAFSLGKWQEAEKQWNDILAREKNNPMALHSLGYSARILGRVQKARSLQERILTRNPENVPALMELALVEEDPKKTQKILISAMELDPGNPRVLVALATAERRSGQTEKALHRMETLMGKWPDNLHARHVFSLCLGDLGRREDMETSLRINLTRSRGRNLPDLMSLAQSRKDAGDEDAALKMGTIAMRSFEADSKRIPAHEKARFLLEIAKVFQGLGDTEKGRDFSQQAEDILKY